MKSPEPDTRLKPFRLASKTIADLQSERDSAINDRQALYAQLQRVRRELDEARVTIDDLGEEIAALRRACLTSTPKMTK